MNDKAISIHEHIGTAYGHRAIVFTFRLADPDRWLILVRVAIDFYGNGSELNGRTYKEIEAVALSSVVAAGYHAGNIEDYTHRLVA